MFIDYKTMLAAEELMLSLLDHADGNGEMQLSVRKGPYHGCQISKGSFISYDGRHAPRNYSRSYLESSRTGYI